MLNPIPQRGARIWGTHVHDPDDTLSNLTFIPREVTFLYRDRGMIWFSHDINPKPDDNGWGWYADQFFYTEAECQQECDCLNREAKGEKVRSSLIEREISLRLKESETEGPVRIG